MSGHTEDTWQTVVATAAVGVVMMFAMPLAAALIFGALVLLPGAFFTHAIVRLADFRRPDAWPEEDRDNVFVVTTPAKLLGASNYLPDGLPHLRRARLSFLAIMLGMILSFAVTVAI